MTRYTLATLSLLILFASIGCGPPASTFRRSALVPGPQGDLMTQPMHREVEASVNAHVTEPYRSPGPVDGDPALQSAHATFTGQARVRLDEHWRIGGQFLYSHSALAGPTAEGTPPMDGESVLGLGPQLSVGWGERYWHVGGLDGARITRRGA